jgi:hypothetical protein
MATRDIGMVDVRYATKMLTLTSTRGMLHLICGREQNGRTYICLLINRNSKGRYSSNHTVKSFINPPRKTSGFSRGDRRGVPFGA